MKTTGKTRLPGKLSSLAARVMSLALALATCGTLCAAAGSETAPVPPPVPTTWTEYKSPVTSITGAGTYKYQGYTALYSKGRRYRAAAWVQPVSGSVPGGYMGAKVELYEENGTMLDRTDMVYNTSADSFTAAVINNPVISLNGVYSRGKYTCNLGRSSKSGSLGKTETVFFTQYGLTGEPPRLEDQLQNGRYPINEQGKTYGSALLEDVVGVLPDLIAVVGTTGQHGFVKREDMQDPVVRTLAEAKAAMANRPGSRMIPMYNLEGEAIGKFAISSGIAKISAGCTLENAQTMVAAGTAAKDDSQLVEQTTLINGDFPRNSKGETYGNVYMVNELGREPDLQAAVGEDGIEGYIRNDEIETPKFDTIEEQLAYQKSQPPFWFIPLYDFQGNEIGQFRVSNGSVSMPKGTTLEQARALVAAGKTQNNA